MVPSVANRREPDGAGAEPTRLARSSRRDALLDAAAELVAGGDVESVSMEAVAEKAGVSRPLVYKHFANRSELLAALYQRESALLHAELAADVEAAVTLEEMFRALIAGALRAQASRGAALAALRSAGVRNRAHREVQLRRDRTTVRYFGQQAAKEFGLEEREARAAVRVALGAVESVLTQWRLRPTPDYAAALEDVYVNLVVGGVERLARRTPTAADPAALRRA
jgi:AcrR family transcriptional regulator